MTVADMDVVTEMPRVERAEGVTLALPSAERVLADVPLGVGDKVRDSVGDPEKEEDIEDMLMD